MDWTDRLTLLVDAVTKNASKDLKGLQDDLAKTDSAAATSTTSTGKLAAGWGFLKDSGLAAGIGVASVAKVVGDSLGKFTGLAKEAVNMSTSLGLTTDEASRWIAIADDYQVSTESISKGLLAVEKSAAGSGTAIEAAGGQIKRAKDGTVDVTATMESVATGLARIQDPAQRAAAGVALFGKNWAGIAPLMAQGGDAIDTAMGQVSDAQTITDDEAKSAERMRLAQDQLGDALGDLELILGDVVAQLAPLVEVVATAVEWFGQAESAVSNFEDKLGPFGGVVKGLTSPLGFVSDALGHLTGSAKDTKPPVDDLSDAIDSATSAADDMNSAYKSMTGALDEESSLLRAKDAIDDLATANQDAAHAATTGSDDQVRAYRKSQESAINAKQATIRYAQSIKDIPPQKVTQINAAIDRGDLVEANRLLDEVARNRSARIDINMFANLTVPAGTPGTIRTILPTSRNGHSAVSPAAAGLGAAPAAAGFGVAAPTVASPATLVVQIVAPSIGNPTHISDAVVAGYTRAVRLAGPRAVTVPASGASWTS